MERERQILRRASWAEALYAFLAILPALPLSSAGPLDGALLLLWAHWMVTAVLAAVLALWLRRPARGSWYAAAALSSYVGFIALWQAYWLVVFLAPQAPQLPRLPILPLLPFVVPVIVGIPQLVVAVACWRSRALRRGARVREGTVEPRPA